MMKKKIDVSFVVAPQTTEVSDTVHKCLVTMTKALYLCMYVHEKTGIMV